jgi:hypothetical protein
MNHCNCPNCTTHNCPAGSECELLKKKLDEHYKLSADCIRQCDEKIRNLTKELEEARSAAFMTNISIRVIPHSAQRYETVGDYFQEGNTLVIAVSKMSDWRYEMLVAIHELVEVVLCRYARIKNKDIDQFDINFEMHRLLGNNDEPGDDPSASYHKQHCIATGVERIMAAVLGVKWKEYENEVNSL